MDIDSHIRAYFTWQEAAIPSDQLDQIDKACGVKLPDEYRTFATAYGAVDFNTSCYNDFLESATTDDALDDVPEYGYARFRIDDFEQERLININSLYSKDEILATFHSHRKGGLWDGVVALIPPRMIPIGRDDADDLFLLESAELGGGLYFWERTESEWGSASNNLIGRVADNFDTFIASLFAD